MNTPNFDACVRATSDNFVACRSRCRSLCVHTLIRNGYSNPPHIVIAVVYIFICLFPVPRIVDTALNIYEKIMIFFDFNVLE